MPPAESRPWIRNTFLAAGAANVGGILMVTRGLTDEYLMGLHPELFSRAGCVLIAIWGLAYVALAGSYHAAPWVSLVFAMEKAFYAASWVAWLLGERPPLAEIMARDPVAGIFYGGYGLLDAAFGVFFLHVFVRYQRRYA